MFPQFVQGFLPQPRKPFSLSRTAMRVFGGGVGWGEDAGEGWFWRAGLYGCKLLLDDVFDQSRKSFVHFPPDMNVRTIELLGIKLSSSCESQPGWQYM